MSWDCRANRRYGSEMMRREETRNMAMEWIAKEGGTITHVSEAANEIYYDKAGQSGDDQ